MTGVKNAFDPQHGESLDRRIKTQIVIYITNQERQVAHVFVEPLRRIKKRRTEGRPVLLSAYVRRFQEFTEVGKRAGVGFRLRVFLVGEHRNSEGQHFRPLSVAYADFFLLPSSKPSSQSC